MSASAALAGTVSAWKSDGRTPARAARLGVSVEARLATAMTPASAAETGGTQAPRVRRTELRR